MRHRLELRFGTQALAHRGLVHNISGNGLGVFTRVVYPPGKAFDAVVVNEAGEEVSLLAEVRWTRLLPEDFGAGLKYEMGVRLIDPSFAWKVFFDQIRDVMERRASAVRLGELLAARFVKPAEVAGPLTRSIAHGGAWIPTADEPRPGKIAVVELALHGLADTIWAVGRVERVVPVQDGGGTGAVDLRYLRLVAGEDAPLRERLDQATDELGVAQVRVLSGRELDATIQDG